jgi:tetratricopeptide (TPR) repeat protein
VAASLAATQFRKGCFTGLSLLVLVYGVTSRQGTQIWQTDFVLWSALTRQDPASRHAAPWLNLGTELTGRGDLEGAERCFRQALAAQYPLSGKDRGLVMNGLGALRLRQAQAKSNAGRLAEVPRLLEEAENFFAQGVGADPGAWLLWKNLGGTRLWRGTATMVTTGRYDRGLIEAACRDFDQALRLSPGNPGLLEIRRTCADFAAKAAIQP